MPTPRLVSAAGVALVLASGLAGTAAAQAPAERLGLGTAPSQDLVRAWDIDVSPGGANLPRGSGSVAAGKQVFEQQCAVCHGPQGQGGPMDRLVGGQGSLASEKPVKTVGSYWPYASTLFDYIRRAMPLTAPQSLTVDQVYAVSAYILNLNDILPDDAVLDRDSLPKVRMPNRDGFEQTDTVTETKAEACMKDCQPLAINQKGATPSKITKEEVQ